MYLKKEKVGLLLRSWVWERESERAEAELNVRKRREEKVLGKKIGCSEELARTEEGWVSYRE